MRVVVAIDSFKGSLSSKEAANYIKDGIGEFCDEVVTISVADGGEGSVEAMMDAVGAEYCSINTFDPLRRPMSAKYAINDELAILEMANSCGLTLLRDGERNPNITTTYGLGIMIKDAIGRGIRKFIVGIGGSATNDAGSGMLEALGYRFYNEDGKEISGEGGNLIKIKSIDDTNLIKELKECEFVVACDVNNPLFGLNGAAYIYGPQKGANAKMVKDLDDGLRNFAKVAAKFLQKDNSILAGSGAAGGLGFGFMGFLNSTLKSGFEIIANVTNLKEKIKGADLVITGEGKMDHQSIMGKTPTEVAKIAKQYAIPVIAFAGAITPEAKSANKYIDAYFCIQQGALSLEEAMNKERAGSSLKECAYQVMRLFLI